MRSDSRTAKAIGNNGSFENMGQTYRPLLLASRFRMRVCLALSVSKVPSSILGDRSVTSAPQHKSNAGRCSSMCSIGSAGVSPRRSFRPQLGCRFKCQPEKLQRITPSSRVFQVNVFGQSVPKRTQVERKEMPTRCMRAWRAWLPSEEGRRSVRSGNPSLSSATPRWSILNNNWSPPL